MSEQSSWRDGDPVIILRPEMTPLTNDLDFDHSEVENATSSNTPGNETHGPHMDGEHFGQILASSLQK